MLMDMSLPKFDIYLAIKQKFQILLRAIQTLDFLTFFNKKFYVMSGLKSNVLSDVTTFLPDNLSGLKILYSDLRQSHEFSGNEQMQMVFTTEQFLEVVTESQTEWDLNPRPLNSVQTLKLTELSGQYIYIYIHIVIYGY